MSCPAQSRLVCLFPAWGLGPSLWGNTSRKLDKCSYKVAAINWAIWGCKVPDLTEDETPGPMHSWEMASAPEPCKCVRFAHCRQLTVETAVFIETLLTLCVEVRWSRYNYLLHPGPCSSWKAETDEEYLRCIEQTLFFKDRRLSMILDDGGTSPTSFTPSTRSSCPSHLQRDHNGVHNLYNVITQRVLKVPAINGNDSITKDKFDNVSGCQEPFIYGIKWTTDDDYGGGSRLWQRGQGLCPGPEGVWGHGIIMEIYTINTLQVTTEGYEWPRAMRPAWSAASLLPP